jgi:hypothetical protein
MATVYKQMKRTIERLNVLEIKVKTMLEDGPRHHVLRREERNVAQLPIDVAD